MINQVLDKSLSIFFKWNLVAIFSSTLDYAILWILVTYFGCHYLVGAIAGVVIGAIVTFLMCRFWVFIGISGDSHVQMFRFTINVGLSALVNIYGVYFFEEICHFNHFMFSRILTAVIVAIGLNYPMQRLWVFR